MTLTPLQRYQQDLRQEGFFEDASQARVVKKLQVLHDELVLAADTKGSLWNRLLGRQRVTPVKGIYLWGGVGCGKTYLMDSFYESLPFQQKMRVHFHRFMKRVHRDLTELAGHKNPLEKVAAGIANETRVICFDEFFVADIADAMLLGTLIDQLFARGVTLVATSNIIPDKLYENGLQRQRFRSAIKSIKKYCDVVNLDSGMDYRLRVLTQARLYHWPLGDQANASLFDAFNKLVPTLEEVRKGVFIEVEGRDIQCRYVGEDVIWFDFDALCAGPRSQNDYIELAREFHAVLISLVPEMDGQRDDEARRFINMIDEFYDRNVKVVISAAVNLEGIYRGGNLAFEFQRTRSRLLEMQSEEYLARPHRA
ncbi:MAG: cell division protein ZapE [Gammaproteobacteria bacterium]|nr:MAG: cell division protein ZapE [Gammaproteobacteria bacterium]RLA50800.1 MAG: cell division protein ZapE [Gammaproteobacteria bacterium]